MRIHRLLVIALVSFLLTACATSLLIGNAQSKLMWSFLKPLVGFNPYEINLLEAPMIKSRMQNLLGPHYDVTVRMLNTASELQQEGALFFLVSRYAPPQFQAITDKAGFVWNADTNQMAVLLIKDGIPTVFAEPIEAAVGSLGWPNELRTALEEAEAYQQHLTEESLKNRAADSVGNIISETLGLDPESKTLLEDLSRGKSVEDIAEEQLDSDYEKTLKHAPDNLPEQPGALLLTPEPDDLPPLHRIPDKKLP